MLLRGDQLLLRESAAGGGGRRWKLHPVFPLVLLWIFLQGNDASVAVDLRTQKIRVRGNGLVPKVASSVSMPTLHNLTMCFEAQWFSRNQAGWLFSYYVSGSILMSFGSDSSEMKLIVNQRYCSVNSLITQANFTSTMSPFCVLWTSSNTVALYYNNQYLTKTCSTLNGRSVPGGGVFQLGGHNDFNGYIYNLRLWDYFMSQQELSSLTCDTKGNIIDWDNSYWNVPSTMAQTDESLSCSCYPNCVHLTTAATTSGVSPPSITSITTSCASGLGCPANCPEEVLSVHYRWPESRPTVSRTLPCFPNKDSNASRTCLINPHNLTSHWSAPDTRNCTVINNIQVSAENATEVAEQLVVITNNQLSKEEVTQVVSKVNELVNVAKINMTLAHTVVTIISNVMNSSETTLGPTSEKALKAVDELAQKIEFEGETVSITSKHLALGISALNPTRFKGTSFSAFIPPNTTEPQIDFVSKRTDQLAQVTLPASLLSNVSLNEAEQTSLSRINFMFFNNTNLFQTEQDGLSLNSYVVASSVGNITISNLLDPVRIEIAHLSEQAFDPLKPPVCVFWDFTMKDGAGGWNSEGCHFSESSRNKTICLCNHLTHFGILMDISESATDISEQDTKILTFITYIGCGISAIFSAVTLLTYIAFKKLHCDNPSKILMNLCTSLLCLNLLFLLDGCLARWMSDVLCVSVAVFLHYFLLTSFTWMGLESVHMYFALIKVFSTYIRRYILKFCIVGWGFPAVIMGVVVAINKDLYGLQEYGRGAVGHRSSEFCWIKNQVVFYVTCVGYFCLIFLLNVTIFIAVMLRICGLKRSHQTLQEEVLRNLRRAVSLTFLLGLTWGFALFAWGPVNLAFMYLFCIFNSLQGLFIFIFHCALNENVQKQWRRYLCCGRFRLSDSSDQRKTETNNTKKVNSENPGKPLLSLGSSTDMDAQSQSPSY